MNGKQQLITFIGLSLIGLTIWQHWRPELKAVLFGSPASKPQSPATGAPDPYAPGKNFGTAGDAPAYRLNPNTYGTTTA